MKQYNDWPSHTLFHMHLSATTLLTLAFACALQGCGTIPDANVNYYLAQTKVSFKVTRSVICDPNNHPIVATTVVPAIVHSAGDAGPGVQISMLRGTFSDSDVKFDFYEDGRLKGVNSTTTGQGETILKAATTLAGSIAAFAVNDDAPVFPDECKFIKDAGAGKPLTLTYESIVNTGAVGINQNIAPDAGSRFYAKTLVAVIGDICAKVEETGKAVVPITYSRKEGDLVLKARQPGWARILVSRPINGGLCAPTSPFWEDKVQVAQLGTDYVIPFPSPELFGKESFTMAFAESGALTSLQFTTTNGSAQALGGLNSLVTANPSESTSAKAADVKAQADLIAQQQRLAQCLADPKNCK